jgi:hypothetical protein
MPRPTFIKDPTPVEPPCPQETKTKKRCDICRENSLLGIFAWVATLGMIFPLLLIKGAGWKDPLASVVGLGIFIPAVIIGCASIPFVLRKTDENYVPHNMHK